MSFYLTQRMSRLKLWMTPVSDHQMGGSDDFQVWTSDDSSEPIRFSRESSRNSSADGSIACNNNGHIESIKNMEIGVWKPLKTCGFCYIQYKRHCQRHGLAFPHVTDKGFWVGHTTKDEHGDVICPELRKLKCPLCYASGKKAHTFKFCPLINIKGSRDEG